jgi:transglutaminase-like putative cysteine protease
MPILTVRHLTTYRYRQPVAFGEHRMMLRPRDDVDQTLLESELAITPKPSRIDWTRDAFGNHVATARFAERAAVLHFESKIRIDHVPAPFRTDDIAQHAKSWPFDYAGERAELARYIAQPAQPPDIARWAEGFLRPDGTADTHALLASMTRSIKRSFRHGARHQKGTQEPVLTLRLASGSCRDLAVLMIAGLRSLGFAARFASGYLNVADSDESLTGGNTHAWVQAHVPGPGWVDFDPSSGTIGNDNLIRVAVAPAPDQAIPLQGSWIGFASDHLVMNVAVKVAVSNGTLPPRFP